MLICPSCCLEERQTKDEFGCGFIEIDECQTDKILVSSLNCLPVTFHKVYAMCVRLQLLTLVEVRQTGSLMSSISCLSVVGFHTWWF